jgi:glyoxylase-like metal-dependent hydrolase (beta-lactamase superfamily II)/rhodanese-related sulfurtransferase
MFIQQLYTGCLSEAAYYIESEGKAAIVDPLRDIDAYLELARNRGASIVYIFETHFHADFVSGHLDLAKETGATIVYGPDTVTSYPVHIAKDRELFKLGKLQIEVLHTPGHTLESSCYLLKDENGKNHCVFTGDTLFVNEVGRPDLAQGGSLTREDLAAMLYDSIQKKLIPLEDSVLIYPAHGPGSSCGKNLGPETSSTMGVQKKSNYALQQPDKQSFIKAVLEGLEEPPGYFSVNALLNKRGYTALPDLMEKGLKPLSAEEVDLLSKEDSVLLLDTREATVFTKGFVPGSMNIGLEGRFAEWAGILIPFDMKIILITEAGKEEESIIRLARVGFDQVKGYLKGGVGAWKEAGKTLDLIIDVEASELAMDLPYDDHLIVVDVRKEDEFMKEHVKDAVNLPLQEIHDPALITHIEETDNLYIHCTGGYRSVIAASILKRQGFHNVRNVLGGWSSIKEQEIPTEKKEGVLK